MSVTKIKAFLANKGVECSEGLALSAGEHALWTGYASLMGVPRELADSAVANFDCLPESVVATVEAQLDPDFRKKAETAAEERRLAKEEAERQAVEAANLKAEEEQKALLEKTADAELFEDSVDSSREIESSTEVNTEEAASSTEESTEVQISDEDTQADEVEEEVVATPTRKRGK